MLVRIPETAIERVDFFGSAGRDRVIALVRQIEDGPVHRLEVRSPRSGETPRERTTPNYGSLVPARVSIAWRPPG
jgi:hypothetical protein